MLNWFNDKVSDAKILDFSTEIYRKKFKTLIGFQILFTIIMVLMIIAGGVIMIPILSWLNFSRAIGLIFFAFILLIMVGVFIGIDKAGVFHITYGYLKGENVTASEAVGKAFQSIKAIAKVITLLVIFILPIIIIIVMMGTNTTTITLWQNRLASNVILNFFVNVVMYSFVAALVGSYLFYSLHIAVFEESTGFAAIKKSIRLAKGEGLKNIYRVFSIFMIQWGVNLSVYSTIAVASGLLYFLLGKIETGHSLITQIILVSEVLKPYLNFILGILLEPIGPIIWTLYYVNSRYKKEGLKVHHMLDKFQEQRSKTPTEAIDLYNK